MNRLRKVGRSRIVKLPDGRKQVYDRMEVFGSASDVATVDSEVFLTYGTAHPKYTTCLLTDQPSLNYSGNQDVEQDLVRVYTEMHATNETQVGKLHTVLGPDGRLTGTASFIQLSSATATPGTPGTTTAPGNTSLVMNRETVSDNGAIRTINRSYLQANATPAQIGDVSESEIAGAFIGTDETSHAYVDGKTKAARSWTYQYIVAGDGTNVNTNWLALNATLAASGDLPTRYFIHGRVVRQGIVNSVISRTYYEKPDTYSYPRADTYNFPGQVGLNGNIPIVSKLPATRETTLRVEESYFIGPTTRDTLTFEVTQWAQGTITYRPALNNPSNLDGYKQYTFSNCIGTATISQSNGYFLGKQVTAVTGTIDSVWTIHTTENYPTGEKLIHSRPVRWAGQMWKKTNTYVTFP